MKKFKHLTYTQRLFIESALRNNQSVREIADYLGVNRCTIYREIKRGRYIHTTDLKDEERYSPDIANEKYLNNLKEKGQDYKIGKDYKLLKFITDKIKNDRYSPEAVLGEIKNKNLKFSVTLSKQTIYNYIDKGLFLEITNKDLPVKKNRRRKYNKIKIQSKVNNGDSIEKRPKHIDNREEFGHWEMDTVIGKKGVSKNSLLVLTERKTRKEIILKLNNHTCNEVVNKINFLEERFGEYFSNIFKTITVDNGTEFSDSKGMEKSIYGDFKRTKIYYCHAYSSYERGSNENQNKLIRRYIPKGTCFDYMDDKQIQEIENWINNYPRKIFNYQTSKYMFDKELNELIKNTL